MSRGTRLGGVAVVALLAACTPEASEGPTPVPETPTMTSQSPSPTPSPTPSPSPTEVQSFPPPPADETEEEAAIREGWMSYWKVLDHFAKNPIADDYTPTQEVTVAQSEQSKAILDEIQYLRDQGWRLEGDQILRKLEIGSPKVVGDSRTVELTYCYDGTHRRIVSIETGEEIVAIDAPTYLVEEAVFEEGLDGLWRASSIRNRREKC